MTNHAELFQRASNAVTAALGPAPDDVDIPPVKRASKTLAGRIDHTLLKPDATLTAIETLCDEAREHGFASVCVAAVARSATVLAKFSPSSSRPPNATPCDSAPS